MDKKAKLTKLEYNRRGVEFECCSGKGSDKRTNPRLLRQQPHIKGELNAHDLNETVTVAKKIIQ